MNTRHNLSTFAILSYALLTSCTSSDEWTVEGNIKGAGGTTIYIENAGAVGWIPMDSVVTDGSGNFSYSHAAAEYPDIYRLRLNGKVLYFPIDSTETVTVTTDMYQFDRDFTLAGSPSAEMLMKMDRRINNVYDNPAVNTDSIDNLKRELADLWLSDRTSIVAYYLINKQINGMPLFDPANKFDLRVIGGVATAFKEARPDDPRTTYIERLYLQNRAANGIAVDDTIVANEISFFDINLYDREGQNRSLLDVAKKNKVVLINFTSYTEEFSPTLNVALNRLYERYHDKGLEIYQIAFDADEFRWRESAKNLPWVTVHNPSVNGAELLLRYNVRSLPTLFIIRNGELLERVTDYNRLDDTIAGYM